MERTDVINPQKEHVKGIFKEYTTPSRVLRSFTNLSNTVIQTALSGQSKFLYEILQNADDAFEDPFKNIEVTFSLDNDYFIVHHNGKGFDFNDVERICDYASQIEEVKANDLSKTGYKGLGFKSLFNLSECIYIISNGYSFRFDKNYWQDPENRPWQVIPIWCEMNELPLAEKYSYHQPVNFILKVINVKQLENQLEELSEHPAQLLFLHRINSLSVNLKNEENNLSRITEKFGVFDKVYINKNQETVNLWITRTYEQSVPCQVKKLIEGTSKFIYPEKIQKAEKIPITFAINCSQTFQKVVKIVGLCFSTLPTQLCLSLPYNLNSTFILNLDRTQFHENEWNEFLMKSVGYLQLCLLKELAGIQFLKNYVIKLLVRNINHPFKAFCNQFSSGFKAARTEIAWIPSFEGSYLLKLGEAWTDDINFFAQNFQNISDEQVCPYLISDDVWDKHLLSSPDEVKHFSFKNLFNSFNTKYYHQLNKKSYIDFIYYLFKNVNIYTEEGKTLKNLPFLTTKNGMLLQPNNAILEDTDHPIPDFLMCNPIDNEYLPTKNCDDVKYWLTSLGAKWLSSSRSILQESVFNWIYNGSLHYKITLKNHDQILKYLAKYCNEFTEKEFKILRERLIVLTEAKQFKLAHLCYVYDATTIEELADVISDGDRISSSYDMNLLKYFFFQLGVRNITARDVLRKSILHWLKNGTINEELTLWNYTPIVKYFALNYPDIEKGLTISEINELMKMPILTCACSFREARKCYFLSAVPNIKGLERAIADSELVFTKKATEPIVDFYEKIGVSKSINPLDVIRRTVLKWIQAEEISNKVDIDNHFAITEFIAKYYLDLNSKDKENLKKLPLLTENDMFTPACDCYWSSPKDSGYYCPIPGIDFIISPNELVSYHFYLRDKTDCNVKVIQLLADLGVRNLEFAEIYEKYSDHLTEQENVEWFFAKLTEVWKENKFSPDKNKILNFFRKKCMSVPCLFSNNAKKCYSIELYSSKFKIICNIDIESLPILAFVVLPEDLEAYLGFKSELDLQCIRKLFEVIQKKPSFGEENFFRTVLKELKMKSRDEINEYEWKLLSEENKLMPAKGLYYFFEENATCCLHSCYLKRINNMSHAETLELAKLCGVNRLNFALEIKGDEKMSNDNLKEFYLARLPFIVLQESRKLNKPTNDILSYLHKKICSLQLFECREIYLQYPFGEPTRVPNYFDELTLYVAGKWMKRKSKVHDYLRHELCINTNIKDIIDMDPTIPDDVHNFLSYLSEEQCCKFQLIQEDFQKLGCNK